MDDNELTYEQLKPFGCKECSNSFTTKHSLKLHTKSIHSKGTFECSKCDFKCDRIGKMTFHMQRHLQQERHSKRSDEYEVQTRIPSIVIKLGNNKLYINHNSATDSQEIPKHISKNELGSEFKEQKQLRVNKIIHRNNGHFSCEICKKRFTRRVRFQKHMIIKHADTKSIQKGSCLDGKHLRCLICHKRFSGKGILKRHMLKHTGENLFECAKCEAKFNQKIRLHQHMMKYHENRPFRCNKCSESFTQCIQLQNHMSIHAALKAFKCTKCEKSFVMRRELKRHMLLGHTNKDPLQSKKPANKLILKRSVSKSTKKNHTTININITVNSENTVKSEKCLKCMKCHEYVKFSELRAHMDMHQNAFRCEECNRIFSSEHSLKIHKAKVHRENVINTDLDIESENINSIKKDSLRSQNINKTKDHNELIDNKNLDLNSEIETNSNGENAAKISHLVNEEQLIRCEICHRVFNTIRSINIHKTRVHKERSNDTEQVSEEENTLNERNSNKTLSIESEKNQIDLKCDMCEKTFHSMRSVNIHKARIHKEYVNSKELDVDEDHKIVDEDHRNTLSEDGGYDSYIDQDQNDFRCEICDKSFHSLPSVNIHKSRAHKEFCPNVILKRLPEIKLESERYQKENMDSSFGHQIENSHFEDFKPPEIKPNSEENQKENIESSFGHHIDNSDFEDYEFENKGHQIENSHFEDFNPPEIEPKSEEKQKEKIESSSGHQTDNSDFEDFEFENKEWQIKSYEVGSKLKIKLLTS